jgi:NADP-dependent 3-hydroxy acid dehydrogenase YdfG
VLQYSPIPHRDFLKPVADTTADDVLAAVEFSVLGPMTAVNTVLPGLRELGRGSILFVNGGSGARPNPKVAGTSIAFAGEGAYGKMLHDTLGPEGIRVAQLIVPGAIEPGDADGLAEQLWQLHAADGEFRVTAEKRSDRGAA